MKSFAYCRVAISPVRSEMKDSAEQVTQLLFGELIFVTKKNKNWLQITTFLDNYEGWIDEKQISYLSEEAFNTWNKEQVVITKTTKLNSPIGKLSLPVGAYVSKLSPSQFAIGEAVFTGKYQSKKKTLIPFAKTFLNTPYLWGGKSNYGIDCSGFTQLVFRSQGIELPRDASQQVHIGTEISRSNAKAGDVAFFTNDSGRIIHVGILLSSSKIIHASGRVKIEKLDDHGIWSEELGEYSHRLNVIKDFRH